MLHIFDGALILKQRLKGFIFKIAVEGSGINIKSGSH
jgi:hypothetical protein